MRLCDMEPKKADIRGEAVGKQKPRKLTLIHNQIAKIQQWNPFHGFACTLPITGRKHESFSCDDSFQLANGEKICGKRQFCVIFFFINGTNVTKVIILSWKKEWKENHYQRTNKTTMCRDIVHRQEKFLFACNVQHLAKCIVWIYKRVR